MRRIAQIQVSEGQLYALTTEGFLWHRVPIRDENSVLTGDYEWVHVPGPGDSDPTVRPPTEEEIAEYLRKHSTKWSRPV